MPRGFTWSVYVDDDGAQWAVQVLSDYVLQPERGWTTAGVSELVALPRGWVPRRVEGVDSTGAQHLAVVASIDAALWSGAVSTFDIRSNDGAVQTCAVVQSLEERRTVVRPET
jgi:hypothetical protein